MSNFTRNSHRRRLPTCGRRSRRIGGAAPLNPDPPPFGPLREPGAPDEFGEFELPYPDDADWEVFVADDDRDPLPEPGDFWDDERPIDD